MTGVEGYMESVVSGLLAGMNAARRLEGKAPVILPETTMSGAFRATMRAERIEGFSADGRYFGIFPPIEPHIRDKRARYAAFAERALRDLGASLAENGVRLAAWKRKGINMAKQRIIVDAPSAATMRRRKLQGLPHGGDELGVQIILTGSAEKIRGCGAERGGDCGF